MQGKYANVIVDISHENVDRPFAYPHSRAAPGCSGAGHAGCDTLRAGQYAAHRLHHRGDGTRRILMKAA